MGDPAGLSSWLRRPVGRRTTLVVALLACLAPAYLFADPLRNTWIRGDDWEYVASSRTFDRALANLFRPHNVHVVPVWRLVSWGVVASAGRLVDVRPALAAAAYAVLATTMMLAGRFVARETRRPLIGIAAMIALGSTALMYPAGTWFSASQALGAAIGVLAMLWYLHGWRRSGGAWRLVLAALAALVAGGSWTAGYVAGPVGTAYLLAGRRRGGLAVAAIPLLVSAVAAATIFITCRPAIEEQSAISFHGRKTSEAVRPHLAPLYTIQAIPERLLLGELGLVTAATFEQSAAIMAAIGVAWLATRRSAPSPLEAAGASLTVGSYLILWTFRTYLPFSSLRGQLPWYDAIPTVGAVLFASGWWAGLLPPAPPGTAVPIRRSGVVGLVALQAMLLVLHVPRMNDLFVEDVQFLLRGMTDDERKHFPIPELKRQWAVYLASAYVVRQDVLFRRLETAERIARSAGIGRRTLRALYGRRIWPNPPVIDDADLLALPDDGPTTDPATVRALLGPPFAIEPEPKPFWIPPYVPWPPRP